jgi:DNA-binding transcriptional regulator YdaS (Cro superfamily)
MTPRELKLLERHGDKPRKPVTPLKLAVKHFGSLEKMGAEFGVSPQAVHMWGEREVPAEYCPRIEQVTKGAVTCEQLRPDVPWGVIRGTPAPPKFQLGDTVRKTKGSNWHGKIVGTYSTTLTPEGYAVESSTEKGSVQIYPAAALEKDE